MGSLRQVTLPSGDQIDYEIDPLGRRIGKRTNGQVQWRLLYQDGLRPLAELDALGRIRSVFVYTDKAHSPSLMHRAGKTWRLISDHLGSIRLVIDAETGEIAQQIDYDAWGHITHDSNPGFQPFGFAGGLYDPDTSLTRFGARDYDAQTGRWTAKDPILFNGGDTNLYGYVLQDPVNLVDPRGLEVSVDADLQRYVDNLLEGSQTFRDEYTKVKNHKTYHLKIIKIANDSRIDGGEFMGSTIKIDLFDINYLGISYLCENNQRRRMTVERVIAHEFGHVIRRNYPFIFNTEAKAIKFENKVMQEMGDNHNRVVGEGKLRWITR